MLVVFAWKGLLMTILASQAKRIAWKRMPCIRTSATQTVNVRWWKPNLNVLLRPQAAWFASPSWNDRATLVDGGWGGERVGDMFVSFGSRFSALAKPMFATNGSLCSIVLMSTMFTHFCKAPLHAQSDKNGKWRTNYLAFRKIAEVCVRVFLQNASFLTDILVFDENYLKTKLQLLWGCRDISQKILRST